MDPISAQSVLATAGAAAAGEGLYVDDVFSTFLYEGTGSAQTITNGIDLSGEGGMVWIKNRDDSSHHHVYDTERGVGKRLRANSNGAVDNYASSNPTSSLTAFNSNGFSVGDFNGINGSNDGMASWTFRKAPGFFDVVTYTGTGVARTISHNLGSVPGLIITKCTSHSDLWQVYHRSLGASSNLVLNATDAAQSDGVFGGTTPTDSVFSLSAGYSANYPGRTFVAYVFAHDDQSFGTNSDEAIIKCGITSTISQFGSASVELGFEPQFLLMKPVDVSGSWHIVDTMRGVGVSVNTPPSILFANTTSSESTSADTAAIFSTGYFQKEYASGNTRFIYMAIRRPNKPPTAGTEVFKPVQTSSQPFSVGFPTDLHINTPTSATGSNYWVPRLTNGYMPSDATNQESVGTAFMKFDLQDSFSTGTFWGTNQTINWQFRRAPGFFDVVTWSGNGSANRAINHNLGVIPELYITKRRTASENWIVTTDDLITSAEGFFLNTTSAKITGLSAFNSVSSPTSSVFYVGSNSSINGSSDDYIAYLFATLDGISKVGSYTGTGSAINVDCGFTAGARFVMIKRTDSTGDWYVWDSARGIVGGNDSYLLWNTNSAQVTNTDYIDPLNAGFTVTSSAPAALNASGGTYLFLAIA